MGGKFLEKSLKIAMAVSVFFMNLGVSHADIVQEGWYKVTVGGQHAGYYVERYEFDPKLKKFGSTYFLKTNALGGDFSESLQAVSSDSLAPLAYKFTNKTGKDVKLIDATFAKDVMTLKITKNGVLQTTQKAIKKGVFLSTFLIFLILQNKAGGLVVDKNYDYQAIAEEDGSVQSGNAYIKGQEDYLGQTAFKILNTFKGTKFVSYVDPVGTVLATKAPLDSLETKKTNTQEEAVGKIALNIKSLEELFGKVPVDVKPKSMPKVADGGAEAKSTSVKPMPQPSVGGDSPEAKLKRLQSKDDQVPKGLSVPPGKGMPLGKSVTPSPGGNE